MSKATDDYLHTPHVRFEVGCSCCGSCGHYQLKSDALDECGRLQRTGHFDVRVFDRMRRKVGAA